MGQFPHRIALITVLLLAMPLLFLGQAWGLPNRGVDRYLFGSGDAWAGAKILALSGGWNTDPGRGADVAEKPLGSRDQTQLLNATDGDRARIIVRYRLYSYQPDEMITFRALAGMHPGHGPWGGMDPRLYQYGGLWIYPVGILLKLAPVTLKTDIAWYLDHPEAFGRFYVVARCYSACWGLIGVAVVFFLVRRITGGWTFPTAAAALFALLPVVVDQSHEAKPHLAGAVLMLCAVLAGSSYVETGKRSTALLAGALCGAALGMVLSTYPLFLILPAMTLLRRAPQGGLPRPSSFWSSLPVLRERVRVRVTSSTNGTEDPNHPHPCPLPEYRERGERRILLAAVAPYLAAIFVYIATNPYVAINLLVNRKVLVSNLGNSAAMYHPAASASTLTNAALLIANGAGVLTAVGGVIGAVTLARRAIQKRTDATPSEIRRRATGLLLVLPAVWMAIQFVALASGKPGEYGRFALYLDIALSIEAIVAIQTFVRAKALQGALVALLLLSGGALAGRYLAGFLRDCQPTTSRIAAAELLARQNHDGKNVLLIASEPAPYCLPPVDLFRWKIELFPRGERIDPAAANEVCVSPVEDNGLWSSVTDPRMSWADRHFSRR